MKRIESLLNREIGLNARSIGASAIEAAVKLRRRACGAPELSDYLRLLEREPSERSALVEEIVVSETWFFRDDDVFKALGRHALSWATGARVLRVLSLPCATGEEAYSVSMTLLDAGLPPARLSVHGVDVSERALEHARRGVYGKNSFRGSDALARGAHFAATPAGFQVVDAVRAPVSFSRGNVLTAALFAARSFDVVLCRNLLIYLDPPARARALDNLCHWLTDDGLFFAGHAEAVELMDPRLQRLAESTPFAYVKRAREPSRGAQPLPSAAAARPRAAGRAAVRRPAAKTAPAPPVPATSPVAASSLERATDLANRGRLREARQLCERVIGEAGPSPEAYCLLGIIESAAGERDSAIECFNKSLYLNQSHHEALVHLALLHEERGELPVAANFRRRAERARRGDSK